MADEPDDYEPFAGGGGVWEAAGRHAGCSKCGSVSFSQEWYSAFGVMICNPCKRGEKLISKSNAKAQFLLTDGDLKQLGCIAKDNPQKRNWSAMKLYLQSQVEDIAAERYGTAEALVEERHQRLEARLSERLKRRRREDPEAEEKERKRLEEFETKLRQEHGIDESGKRRLLAAAAAANGSSAVAVEEDDGDSSGSGSDGDEGRQRKQRRCTSLQPPPGADEVDAATGKVVRRYIPGGAAAEVEEF